MQAIRLNKQTKTIKVSHRDTSLTLDKNTNTIKVVNRRKNLSLQHSGKTGPQGPKGDTAIEFQPDPPVETDVLWVDTDDETGLDAYDFTSAEKAKLAGIEAGAQVNNLIIGTELPTPALGEQVLWVDTTGGNITMNLVTGE